MRDDVKATNAVAVGSGLNETLIAVAEAVFENHKKPSLIHPEWGEIT